MIDTRSLILLLLQPQTGVNYSLDQWEELEKKHSPEEIKELMDYGITRIYSPDDGRELGLQGMINDLVQRSDYALGQEKDVDLSTETWAS